MEQFADFQGRMRLSARLPSARSSLRPAFGCLKDETLSLRSIAGHIVERSEPYRSIGSYDAKPTQNLVNQSKAGLQDFA